jgi:zinc protease
LTFNSKRAVFAAAFTAVALSGCATVQNLRSSDVFHHGAAQPTAAPAPAEPATPPADAPAKPESKSPFGLGWLHRKAAKPEAPPPPVDAPAPTPAPAETPPASPPKSHRFDWLHPKPKPPAPAAVAEPTAPPSAEAPASPAPKAKSQFGLGWLHRKPAEPKTPNAAPADAPTPPAPQPKSQFGLGWLHRKPAPSPATAPPPQPAPDSTPAPAGPPIASGPEAQPFATHTQGGSDVTPDPALRAGILPNGMRYVILRNASPPGQASLRLRIGAGSLEETDDQRGLMHFIEHMAFNGSANVPQGEMIKTLERHGLAFGPDTNAFTSFDQTVYQLDLPETDDDSVDTGLMLMRETAGNLLLDQTAMDKERGVILSEERLRDTPQLRIARQQYDFYYKGQLPPLRFPIGDIGVVKTAPRDRLADLYGAYYRPDRATLVVVGDFDVDKMEAKIKSGFGDWQAQAADRPDPAPVAVAPRSPETRLMIEPGGPSSLNIAWLNAPDLRADTLALRRERMVRDLGFAVLNRRYERLARADRPAFIAAGALRFTNLKTADVTQISVTAQPGRWQEAMAAADQEQRRIAQYGVSQAELDREITEARTELQQAVAGQATRKTPDLAGGIADSVEEQQVFTAPAEDLDEFEAEVRGLKAAEVSAALKAQFQGQGPLVFMTSPTPIDGGEKAVADAFAQAQQTPVTAPTAVQTKAWGYVDFGATGKVAERKEVLDLDTTFVRFENGVRLTIKPTKFRDDQVLVAVRVGDGYQDLPRDRVTPMWAVGSVFSEGGLGQLTAEEMEQVLSGKVYGAGLSVGDDAFVLSGTTRKADTELQLQVLAAYLTDPAWRPEPFERMRTYGDTLLGQVSSSPGGVFGRDGESLLRSGDPRWAFPSRAQIDNGKLSDLKALLTVPLTTGPIEVVIVGDVDVDEAIELTAQTFGALPPRHPVAPPADARRVVFPAPTSQPLKLTHQGRADQAIGYVAWPTTDFPSDPQGARETRALEQVLQLRLTDTLRSQQAVTYSPSTGLDMSWNFTGYGYVSAQVEAPPDKLDGFFTTVQAIAQDLRDKPVSADELQRALNPRVEFILKAQQTNEYWLGQLSGAQADPRKLEAIRASIPGLQRINPADVQKAAQKWLRDDKAWKLVIVPEAK